jgi:CRP/FNR family transcriptional regulator, cyclic AMP receptor protein
MRKVLFILGELSDDDIEWMIAKGFNQKVEAGRTLIREGQPVDALYIVLDGSVSVLAQALGGKEVARLGVGEMVGEMSLVDKRPPSATVKASEKGTLFVIPRQDLVEKLEWDQGFAARFYRAIAVFLSDRLRGTVSRLGYGQGQQLTEDVEYADELDPAVLDTVYLAGTRFDRMLKRLLADK